MDFILAIITLLIVSITFELVLARRRRKKRKEFQKSLDEIEAKVMNPPTKVKFQPASTLASAQPYASFAGSYAAVASVAMLMSGAVQPPTGVRFLHPNEAVKTKEDIVDEGFTRVRKYITDAEELDRGHLQHLIENLRWTTDHVIGTSGPETEGALDMNLFAKLSSELIEESEKVLSLDTVSKSQLRSIQLRLEGLFEFLKRYPDETPRRKEVEDALLIVDDFMHKTKTEAGR